MSKVKLTIPNPCHEDWNKMSPNDKGRFCDACNKTVIDFSGMNQEEVINYFLQLKKESNEPICGHIKKSHLATPRTFQPLRIAAVGLLLLSSTYLLHSCTTKTEKDKIETSFDVTASDDSDSEDDSDLEGEIVMDDEEKHGDYSSKNDVVSTQQPSKGNNKNDTSVVKPRRIPITCGEPVTPPMLLGKFMMPTDPITNQGEAPIEVQKED